MSEILGFPEVWIDWIPSSSEEVLNAVQQDSHIIDGEELHIQAQRPKGLQGLQTAEEGKDFGDSYYPPIT